VSGFLLDTNVISIASPSGPGAPKTFAAWLRQQEELGTLYLSVVTVHEIEKGIRLLEHKKATARAADIRSWLERLITIFEERILPFDIEAATVAGELEALALSKGHQPGMADAMIAATAKSHDLTIVTRNTKHFAPFGIDISTPEQIAG
jgi:predicted nucleic acid-binding protein